ncbi:hypothetical protein ABZ912_46115 [Nonomuraea angiospora]|uniref:hypothetical protein n=1 Tax=Nonomuraea angiospora TaxID=46172 RepID=UPI0033D0F5AD
MSGYRHDRLLYNCPTMRVGCRLIALNATINRLMLRASWQSEPHHDPVVHAQMDVTASAIGERAVATLKIWKVLTAGSKPETGALGLRDCGPGQGAVGLV